MSAGSQPGLDLADYQGLRYAKRLETISRLVVAIGALIYATGFLVVITFLGKMGIRDFGDIFRAKYIHVGMLYWLIPVLPGGPILAFFALKRQQTLRRTKELMRPSSLFLTIQLVIFIYVVVLIARPEFVHLESHWIAGTLLWTVVGMRIINAAADRLKERKPRLWKWAAMLRMPHIAVSLGLELICIYPLRQQIFEMFWRSVITMSVFVVAGMLTWRFISLANYTNDLDEKSHLWVAGSALLCGLYLFSVFSFAYSIYPFVPAERGGGNYSYTADVLVLLVDTTGIPSDLLYNAKRPGAISYTGIDRTAEDNPKGQEVNPRTKAVKLIEQTSSWVYIASPDGCKQPAEWKPHVTALQTAAIKSIVALPVEEDGSKRANQLCYEWWHSFRSALTRLI